MWPIKQRFIQWFIRKALKTQKKRETVQFDAAKQVAILFQYNGSVSAGRVRIYADRLREQGKKVDIVGYWTNPEEKSPKGIVCYGRKDFSNMGKITHPKINKFLQIPYDYLFYFGDSPTEEIQYLLAGTLARCRVAAYHTEATSFFELMIQGTAPAQWDDLYQEITAYTQKLRTAS